MRIADHEFHWSAFDPQGCQLSETALSPSTSNRAAPVRQDGVLELGNSASRMTALRRFELVMDLGVKRL